MPVIVMASSKGGAGKTTTCVALGCELARQGALKGIGVSLIDADPNKHTAGWGKLDGKPANITLFDQVSEESILDVIEEAKKVAPFVLVDLEGISSNTVMYAISQADLVIIPCQPSQNDAKEAVKTIKMVRNSARMIKHEIPFSVVFTRVNAAIVTKTAKHLAAEFRTAGINLFDVSLIDREAFKSIFAFGGSINDLEAPDKKSAVARDKAAENVRAFAEEVKQLLKANMIKNKERGVA